MSDDLYMDAHLLYGPKKPIAWIIETKSGPFLTVKPEVAEKHMKKEGSIVTPYYSKVEK